MNEKKEMTNNDLKVFFERKFEDVNKQFKQADKRLKWIENRLDKIDSSLRNSTPLFVATERMASMFG